jgi:hypothetical protein
VGDVADDVRVAQLGEHARLDEEAHLRAVAAVADHLDRDRLLRDAGRRAEDRPHAADTGERAELEPLGDDIAGPHPVEYTHRPPCRSNRISASSLPIR